MGCDFISGMVPDDLQPTLESPLSAHIGNAVFFAELKRRDALSDQIVDIVLRIKLTTHQCVLRFLSAKLRKRLCGCVSSRNNF